MLRIVKIRVGDGVAAQLEICAILPADYPSAAPPSVQLVSCMLPEQLLNWAAAQLEAMFTPGGFLRRASRTSVSWSIHILLHSALKV